MAAVLTRLRAELRTRWRAWTAIAFLIGLAGGVVLTTAAGARRTGSAYARFLRASHGADLLVSPNDTGFPGYYRTLERETGATVAPVIGYGVAPVDHPRAPFLISAGADARFGRVLERPKITAGRMPRPGRADEVFADRVATTALHLRPGSRLRLIVTNREEELPNPSRDPTITVNVVGIGVTRDSAVSVNTLATVPNLLAGPAFARKFGPDHYAFDGAYVALARGTSKAAKEAFSAKAQAMARRFPPTGGGVFVADESEQAATVEHAIRPQAVALALFAALTALTALFAIGQLLARQLFLTSSDNHVLGALGMTRRQLFLIGLSEIGAVAVAGGVVAMIVGALASPIMPIGPARVAEPSPGLALDWTVLAAGFVLIVVTLLAGSAWPAWRAARLADPATDERGARRPSGLARRAFGAGAPPNMAIGIGYAVHPGRGRTAVPVRSAIAVTVLAVTALAGALTFGANLDRLVGTPRLYGQSWDVTADAQFTPLTTAPFVALLRHEPGVSAWTFGVHESLTVDGHDVPAIGLIPTGGHLLAPTVVEGRPAVTSREIVLGATTLARLHRHVGETVETQLQVQSGPGGKPPTPVTMRIVGRSVFPYFGEGSFTPTGLGIGAQVATAPATGSNTSSPPNFVLVRVAAGPHHDTQVAQVVRDLGRTHLCGNFNQCFATTASRPSDILNYARVRSTPVALAVVLALLAAAIVTNTLVSSIRRRRRDLAILKTLGFERRQISAAVAWQATTLVMVALAIGLPLGAVLGRAVWSTFAANLGIPGRPRTPARALFLAVPIALVVANAIAAVPGILARRLPPASTLRAE